MNRNVESHFSELPSVDIQRSIFDHSAKHVTSFNVGQLIPFFIDEVLPGDTFNVTTSMVLRLQTLLTPPLDNLYADIYYFYVRMRDVWSHAKEFFGENTSSAWIPQVEYQVPTISAPANTGFATGTLADYFGLPIGVVWDNQARNRPIALPFRAYALIADQFFRDENLSDPLNIPMGDSNHTGTNGSSYINDVANGGKPFLVAKYHDYFTSCLPNAQKHDPVELSLSAAYSLPVISGNKDVTSYLNSNLYKFNLPDSGSNVEHTIAKANSVYSNLYTADAHAVGRGNYGTFANAITESASGTDYNFQLANLWTAVPAGLNFSINELRLAFQLQKYYEKLALGGSRYTEYLKMMFGVTAPDANLQRPEYLGGHRVPINIDEVINSAQSQQDFLGDLGAMSVTSDIHEDFVHSFTEHGYVIGLICLRYDHSYPQGMDRMWTRRKITDYYNPVFANIGEQPVGQYEICANAANMDADTTFGFQEAWASYRYKNDKVSGEMRPGISNTLASWHFADYYTQAPTLSDSWIREDKTNVDRTLAVTSQVSNQAFADFYVKNIVTRAMPMYSIPGLVDHH